MRKLQSFALVTAFLLSAVNLSAQQLRSIAALEAVDGNNRVVGPVCADYNGPYAMVCLKSGDVPFRLPVGKAGFLLQSETYFASADCTPPAFVPAGSQIYPTANIIGTSVFVENRSAAPQPAAVASKRDQAGNCVAVSPTTVDNTRPTLEVPGFGTFAAPFWVREAGNATAAMASVSVSAPTGVEFSVDGVTYTGSRSFSWFQGSQHTIATTSPQSGPSGTRYVFNSWSDGGDVSHTINASSGSYTANFTTQYQLTTAAFPTIGGSVSSASGDFHNAGSVVSLTATQNSGYQFGSWTGAVADPSNATTTVTMDGPVSVSANFQALTLLTWTTAPPATAIYNGTFSVAASTNSGSTIQYTASGGCTINDATVTMTSGTEPCTVKASDAGNANYLPAMVQETTAAVKAAAVINVSGFNGTYDGAAHGASGTATGVKSEDLGTLLNLGTTFTNPPGGTASWTFAGNVNYESANGTATVTISKATTSITWTAPADIVYGTALSAVQFNATATQAGAFTYTPALGTLLKAGNGQVLSVTFTPSDLSKYSGASATVLINVKKAPASVSPNAATKVYGGVEPTLTGALSGFLASDGVTAIYSRAAGETVTGGPYAIAATLNAPPATLSNYNITYGAANLTVTPRSLTVTANNASRPYGTANPVFTTSFSGLANGDTSSAIQGAAALTTTALPTSMPGSYPISVAQGSLGSGNYTFVFVNGTLNVTATGTTPSSNGCNGAYSGPFVGNLTISNGQTCIFFGSGGITGNIQMNGGSLVLQGQRVTGNVQAQNNSSVTITGGNITGNVQSQNNAGTVDISSAVFRGNVHIQNNTGVVRVFNNSITGNLHCQNNSSITGGGNTASQKQGQCSAF